MQRRSTFVDDEDADAQMAIDILATIEPALTSATMDSLSSVLKEHRVNVTTLRKMGHNELSAEPFGISSSIERARILAAIECTPYAPPPNDLFGGPVIVRPKMGFTRLDSFDTVSATVEIRFFLDCYWTDPRIKGRSYVPDGMWRPDGVLLINRCGEMEVLAHEEKPVIADVDPATGLSRNGLLLWPAEYAGTISNPMSLKDFPYDFDSVVIKMQQSEDGSSADYVFRPYEDAADEATAVRFFFDIEEQLTEWQLRGHSRICWESVGGIPKPFAQMQLALHFSRKWSYYAWKVVLPLVICTVFCFSSFFFMPQELGDRTAISTTMFLATCTWRRIP